MDATSPSQNGGSAVELSSEKPVDSAVEATTTPIKGASLIINESDDKLDEFSRLELEMAELDKTDDGDLPGNSVSCPNNASDELKDGEKLDKNEVNDSKTQNIGNNSITHTNGQNAEMANSSKSIKISEETKALDHEDLIAVLKGDTIDNLSNDRKEPQSSSSTMKESEPENPPGTTAAETVRESENDLLISGVTIEGEGEYQIMEVVDDFDDDAVDMMPSTSKASTTCLQSSKVAAVNNQKLTPEEVRAMAMEQIAGLNARLPRRRKQDIKPLQVETSELVSNLGADWSDDDDDLPVDVERPTLSKNTVTTKQAKAIKKDISIKRQSPAPSTTSITGDIRPSTSPGTAKKRRNSTNAKVTSVVVVKPAVENSSNQVGGVSTESAAPQAVPEITGFRRTRTIKRRIIWDPDAPETSFSYAKLVRSNTKDRQETPPPAVAPKPRTVTPKEIIPGEKRGPKRALTPSQSNAAKIPTNEGNYKGENSETHSNSKQANRANTISPDVGSKSGKKKKISEIDRLMGDEGAANMLNSLENERNKPGDDSDSKPHKPLMRNRAGVAEKTTKKDTTSIPTAATPTSKAKRGLKAKPSTSWDYVYQKKQQLSEDSMIIRRRSNSSYSSNASQHRLSLDGPSGPPLKGNSKGSELSSDDAADSGTSTGSPRKTNSKAASKSTNNATDEESPSPSMKSINVTGNKNFEFAKPKDTKSAQKTPNRRSKGNTNSTNTLTNDIKKALPKRGAGRVPAPERNASNTEQSTAQSPVLSNSSTIASLSSEDVTVRKIGKTAHILFNMNASQINCTFTPQLMNKIVSCLNNLAEDVNCHVVVVTTNSPHFCQGVDIANLATGNADQRKSAAIVLATATKNFLRTLATFPKPLVAGIHGTIIGLGVIQLPLYDVVIASDKTSFETPYAKIGQCPEGYCIWQSLPNIRETAKTKLLWMAEKMYSTEASTTGLIDKLTTAERVNEDALNIAKKISAMSSETYRYMKKYLVQKRSEAINLSLDNEFDEITNQWTSIECFNKFKKSLDVGHF